MVRMNLESWSDAEVYSFIQILLVAKFDSGRSELIAGHPLVEEVLEELFNYKMEDYELSQARQSFLDTELSENAFALVLDIVSDAAENDRYDGNLEELSRTAAFPFKLSKDEEAKISMTLRSKISDV